MTDKIKNHEAKLIIAMKSLGYSDADIDNINAIRGAIDIGMDIATINGIVEHIDNEKGIVFFDGIKTKYKRHYDVLNKGRDFRVTLYPNMDEIKKSIEGEIIAKSNETSRDTVKNIAANIAHQAQRS